MKHLSGVIDKISSREKTIRIVFELSVVEGDPAEYDLYINNEEDALQYAEGILDSPNTTLEADTNIIDMKFAKG